MSQDKENLTIRSVSSRNLQIKSLVACSHRRRRLLRNGSPSKSRCCSTPLIDRILTIAGRDVAMTPPFEVPRWCDRILGSAGGRHELPVLGTNT